MNDDAIVLILIKVVIIVAHVFFIILKMIIIIINIIKQSINYIQSANIIIMIIFLRANEMFSLSDTIANITLIMVIALKIF